MKTGKSLIELATELQRQSTAKVDMLVDSDQMTMANDGKIMAVSNHDNFTIADNAHSQLSTHLEIPKRYYDRMLTDQPDLLATNVNHWLHTNNQRRMVRTLDGNFRAFLSSKYRRIDNDIIANMALDTLLNMPGLSTDNIASCEITDNRLYLKVVFDKIQGEVTVGDVVQSGITISNSEIGRGRFDIAPFVHRLVCLNGMTINDAKMSKRHVGQRLEHLGVIEYQADTLAADDKSIMLQLRDMITSAATQSVFNQHLERMRAATMGEKIEKPVEAVEVLANTIGLNADEKTSVLENLIQDRDYSRWGALNAVTKVANTHDDYDRASELETLGGRILNLNQSEWRAIASADTMPRRRAA